ncbi:MAG: ATP synthase subunit I [Pseudomonadota bacterium]
MKKYEDSEIMGIYIKALLYMLVGSILLFALFYQNISYALGFASGGIVCLVNFRLMVRTINEMLRRESCSKAFFSGVFCIRLFITTFTLWYALESEALNLFTTVLGMLSVKTVIIAGEIIRHIKSLRDLE